MNKLIRIAIFLVGFVICSFPFFSNLIRWQYQKSAIESYITEIETDESDTTEYWNNAYQYNDILRQSYGQYMSGWKESILSDESYYNILNIVGNGIMGSIEIPKINVNLPIYHGTEEAVLSIGIGHLKGTSLPVGGINTRAVLTGHRGSPNSKLFTRLDEMKINDLFFIRILDEVLAYKVIEIDVINPEDVERLDVMEGKDVVTLLTCTPYGINSHRLIVTGERVEYVEEVYEEIEAEQMSIRESVFTFFPFLLLGLGGGAVVIGSVRKKTKGAEKIDENQDREEN